MRKRARKWTCSLIAIMPLLIAALAFSGAAFAQTGGPPRPGETPIFKWIEGTYIGMVTWNVNAIVSALAGDSAATPTN